MSRSSGPRRALLTVAAICGLASAAAAQITSDGTGGVLRVLDKNNGIVTDIELAIGEAAQIGLLTVRLGDCRYPQANPSGDAFVWLTITYADDVDPVFRGWMVASNPAVSAMDHPRYDVWALSCTTS